MAKKEMLSEKQSENSIHNLDARRICSLMQNKYWTEKSINKTRDTWLADVL